MNIDTQLEKLKEIQEVETPAFLLTRIKQQIANRENNIITKQWKLVFTITVCIVLALNIFIFLTANSQQNNSTVENIISSMSLHNSNNLYHE